MFLGLLYDVGDVRSPQGRVLMNFVFVVQTRNQFSQDSVDNLFVYHDGQYTNVHALNAV